MGIWDLSIAPTTWGKQLISWNASIAFLVSASPFGKLIKSLAVIRSAEQNSSFSFSPVHVPTPKTRPLVLYEFPEAIRYKATSPKGLGLEVGFTCLCPFVPDGVQPNCKQTGTFASRYRNVLLAKYYLLFWFKTVCSNQNCGLSRTHTTFLVWHIFLWEWKKYASVLLLLFQTASNLSLCWNRFLWRTKTKCLNPFIIGRTSKQGSSASPTIILIYRVSDLLKLLRWNIILLVEKPIIFKLLNGVSKQSTLRNVERQNRRCENTTNMWLNEWEN